MGKYFGTDGFRGKANVDLNSNHAFLIGSFFGQLAAKEGKKENKIVIGQDTRLSGDMFVNALAAGITSAVRSIRRSAALWRDPRQHGRKSPNVCIFRLD